MSATLNWNATGPGARTGSAVGNFWTDLKNLIDTKLADATYLWQVASSNLGSTPYHICLKRKDGSAGRILLWEYTSVPAGNNTAVFETTPSTSSYIQCAWFPAGNVDTPSNLTAASGTILGDDTGCTYACSMVRAYATSEQWFYAECEEGMVFWTGMGTNGYWCGAGNLIVDANDVAYACAFGSSNTTHGATAGGWFPYQTPTLLAGAGASSAAARAKISGSNKVLLTPWAPVGNWMAQVAGSSTDVLTDTINKKTWFVPVTFMTQNEKGAGFNYKLRQIAYGPAVAAGPLSKLYSSGPTLKAISTYSLVAAGGGGHPWLLNFKV